jgi:hypothetical protein
LTKYNLNPGGFENLLESNEARVRLAFSRHPVVVEITAGKSEGSWKLHFSDNLDILELKRNLNTPLFPPNEISPWDRQTLAVILERAAELGITLPDTPVRKQAPLKPRSIFYIFSRCHRGRDHCGLFSVQRGG